MAEKQQGASITFGTDGGSYKFTQIGSYSEPIPVIDDTDLSTTGKRTKCFGELGDPQPFTCIVQSDSDAVELTKGLVQTITKTSPAGAFDNAENWAGTGAIIDIATPEFGSDTEAIATRQITIQFDGKTGPTRTVASDDP